MQGQRQCGLSPVRQATVLLTDTSKLNIFFLVPPEGSFCAEPDLLGMLWHHLAGQMDQIYLD